MRFRLRSTWNVETDNDDYAFKLQEQGISVEKIEDEWCPQWYVEIPDLGTLLTLANVVKHEIIYYKDNESWVLEIYDGLRE